MDQRVLRVRRRIVQTPVRTYQQRETGRTITLIGTFHLAEPGYYRTIERVIVDLETVGAVVHYERVSKAPHGSWAAATAQDRATRIALERRLALLESALHDVGWVHQRTLGYQSAWRNVDVTDLQFIQLVGAERLQRIYRSNDALAKLVGQSQIVLAVLAVMTRLLAWDRLGLHRRFRGSSDPDRRRYLNILVNHRDRLAATTMLKAENAPDGVLLWGAAHLPGISAHLTADGFGCVKTDWLAVGRVPAMVPSLRIVRPVKTIRAIRRRRRERSA